MAAAAKLRGERAQPACARQASAPPDTDDWSAPLAMLLRYAAPENWHDGLPVLCIIPQDTASALATKIEALVRAQSAMRSKLESTQKQFSVDRQAGGSGRVGACASLLAMIEFMQATSAAADGQLVPPDMLLLAVAGLDLGHDDPLLARPKTGGRPRAPLPRGLLLQHIAVAVSILMDDKRFNPGRGARETAAIRYIQKRLARIKCKKFSDATIAAWRNKVMGFLPRGFGVPGKQDRIQLEPAQSEIEMRVYVKWWTAWREEARRANAPGTRFVDLLVGPELEPLVRTA
jgi:hypothetical protein